MIPGRYTGTIQSFQYSIILFYHKRKQHSLDNAMPLLMTHGWPDSFLRYAKAFPLLSDYDLIVPSLPGFAFSTLPSKGFVNNAEIAETWHRLMSDSPSGMAAWVIEKYRAWSDTGIHSRCHRSERSISPLLLPSRLWNNPKHSLRM